MNACFTTGLMQQFHRLFGVLVLSLFSYQMAAYAVPADIGNKMLRSIAPVNRADAGSKLAFLNLSAKPYALSVNAGKQAVRFSVPVRLTKTNKTSVTVFLRRKGDRQSIKMNDLGESGDYVAKDGIHGVSVQIDTSKIEPDTCLVYEAFTKEGRTELISPALRLCVSSFPVRAATPNVDKPVVLDDGVKAVADEVLLYAKPTTRAATIRELAHSINASVVGSIIPLNLYQLRLPSPVSAKRLLEIVAQLNTHSEIMGAAVNTIGQPAGHVDNTTDPEFANQHGVKLVLKHPTLAGIYVWDADAIGTGETVIVTDYGLDRLHPDFGVPGDCQLSTAAATGVANTDCGGTNNDYAAAGVYQWHGTRVAGVIAGKAYNSQGIAGVAHGSKIYSYQVASFALIDMDQIFIDAGGYVISEGASVINASISGGPWNPSGAGYMTNINALCTAVNTAVTSGFGAIVVIAAGNNGADNWYFPARCNQHAVVPVANRSRIIAVGNSTSVDTANCGSVAVNQRCAGAVPYNADLLGSNYGAWVDIAAPGSDIRTTTQGGIYTDSTGTSFSAPIVSGAVAILKSCGVPLDSIKSTLISSSSVDVPYPTSLDLATTTPRLDVYSALSSVNHAPTGASPATNSINEGSPIGTLISTLSANDVDTCDKFTYSITGANPGGFTIDANTGELRVGGVALDYEGVPSHSYSLTVQVTDFFGSTFSQPVTVNLNNQNDTPPIITSNGGGASASVSVAENTAAVTTAAATDADNLLPLTYSLGGTDAAIFNLDSATGVLTFLAAPDFETPADAGANNVYDIVVQVTDGTFTDTQAIAVTVTNVNEAPVANSDTLGASQNTPVIYGAALLLGNDTDVDAGTTLSIAGVTNGANGTVVLNGDGSVTFTPTGGYSGTANFTYTATDGSLPSNVATVTVNVVAAVNHAPVAFIDTLAATEDTPVIYAAAQLLGNDTDVDAGTTLSIAGVTSGAGGAVVLNGDGTVTFSPNADFNGVANFTYTASDGSLSSNVATVTVNVAPVNDAPTGLPFISGTRTVGQTLTANTLTATLPNPIFDADGLGSFSYQWSRTGIDIPGATASTYELVMDDFGQFMSVCVSYTDGGGTPESVCSATDATAVGDPHLTTVDGLHYDFQGAGEFVALRGAEGMEIQLRMAAVSTAPPLADSYTGLTSGASVNTAVAARVGKHRVTYQPDTGPNAAGGTFVLRVDGVPTTLPVDGIDLGDGGRVISQASGIQIDFPDQTTLMINNNWGTFYGASWLHVSVFHTSAYDGIMGARSKGSWLPRLSDGSVLGAMPAALHDRYVELYVKFADSWRVNKKTSLFDYAEGTSTVNFTNRAWPTENGPYDTGSGPVAEPLPRNAAVLACRGVVGKHANADCVFDVRVMGNKALAKGHLLNQKVRTGLTAIIVRDDRDVARDKEVVTFTATVARHAAIARRVVKDTKIKGRDVPTGWVQFTVNGKKAGRPVKLNTKGQAIWRVSRQKVEKQLVGAQYIPAKGNVFLPSRTLGTARLPVDVKK